MFIANFAAVSMIMNTARSTPPRQSAFGFMQDREQNRRQPVPAKHRAAAPKTAKPAVNRVDPILAACIAAGGFDQNERLGY